MIGYFWPKYCNNHEYTSLYYFMIVNLLFYSITQLIFLNTKLSRAWVPTWIRKSIQMYKPTIACAKAYLKFSFFLLCTYSFLFALFVPFHYSQLVMPFLIHCSHPVKIGQNVCSQPYDFASIASNRFISFSLFSLLHSPSPFLNTYPSPTAPPFAIFSLLSTYSFLTCPIFNVYI